VTGVQRELLFSLIVLGLPAPQGSKTPTGAMRRTKTGGLTPVLRESSKKVKPWREAVQAAALLEVGKRQSWSLLDEPLIAEMVFTMPKPVSAPKTRRTWPMRQPDLSKLCRSTEDALTKIVWADDARVIEYARLAKVYPREDVDALPGTGAVIRIYRLLPQT